MAMEETVICSYRVKQGAVGEFELLLARHWPTLHRLGFVTDEPARVYRSLGDASPTFVEVFTWRDGAFKEAHEHPDVVAIWEPMDPLCEDRDGRPGMEFPHFERLAMPYASR